jgi:hypothetical protein
MHNIYRRNGKKGKIVQTKVPLVYQHTSPYPIHEKCIETDAKHVYKIEKSHELRCENPDMKPIHILKLFNKEWPKLD